jgi:hypothetical protein
MVLGCLDAKASARSNGNSKMRGFFAALRMTRVLGGVGRGTGNGKCNSKSKKQRQVQQQEQKATATAKCGGSSLRSE